MEIREKFVLSGQYTPRTLWDEYKDSIFMELKRMSVISGVLLRDAEIVFPEDDEMIISLAESPISRNREPEIRGFLQGIFLTETLHWTKQNDCFILLMRIWVSVSETFRFTILFQRRFFYGKEQVYRGLSCYRHPFLY